MNLNKVTVAGNTTRDVELRFTPKGTAIAQVGIAVNRRWKGEDGEQKEEVTFIDATFWGKTAEIVAQYFRKGSPIYIEGRLKLDSWDDKQTGQKRSKLSVVAESFQFVGRKAQGDTEEEPSGKVIGGEQRRAKSEPSAKEPATGDESPESDDVPF